MSDRFLHRGKRLDDGGWEFGAVVCADEEFCIYNRGGIIAGEVPIDPATISQCTGVRFDGILIFEGDICVDEDGGIVAIKWNGDGFVGEYVSDGEQIPLMHFIYLKVIGNIHDNPELLGGIK